MSAHLADVLIWTTLTAATIGPGTVVLCSRTGSEQNTALLWCVLVASGVAWVMQEAAARITIASSCTLSECIRMLSPSGSRLQPLRHTLIFIIVVVSLACEANNLIGAVAAASLLATTPEGEQAVRLVLNIGLGPAIVCLQLSGGGSTARLGHVLTLLVIAMLVCFSVTIVGVGLPTGLAAGLLPTIPEGGASLALSLVGTTAVPLNVLLGSALARGNPRVREGVALSACLSGLLSLLIMLVGTSAPHPPGARFEVREIAAPLERVMGPLGRLGFALGLGGAAVSSALATPLATAVALDDLVGWRAHHDGSGLGSSRRRNGCGSSSSCSSSSSSSGGGGGGGGSGSSSSTRSHADGSGRGDGGGGGDGSDGGDGGEGGDGGGRPASVRWWHWQRHGRACLQAGLIVLGMVPSLLGLPAASVILVAAVANGLLLPMVSACLALCLNHPSLMPQERLQSAAQNARLLPCVGLALLLASVVLLRHSVAGPPSHALPIALPLSLVGLGTLLLAIRRLRRSATDGTRVPMRAAAWCDSAYELGGGAEPVMPEAMLEEAPKGVGAGL